MRKKLHFSGIKRLLPVFLALIAALPTGAYAVPGKLITQNWAESAVFYTSPCEETETFRMSGEEFLSCWNALENRLLYAYSAYLGQLEGEQREALIASQRAWLKCYYAYEKSLSDLWLEPVKIHFMVTGHERRTNVYREIIILLLTNRITDLEEWRMGRFASFEEEAQGGMEARLQDAQRQLRVDMGLCAYVIQEEYRLPMMDAHQAFFEFLTANGEFVAAMTDNDAVAVTAESLLQADRMQYMTEVHYEGCRFFRREREE